MKKLLALLVILSTAFAACNYDNICDLSKETKSCPDCSISGEVQCYEDGACTAGEKELGNCSDCITSARTEETQSFSSESVPSVPVTGLMVLGGGFVSVGFLVAIGLVIAFLMLREKGNGTPLSG